MAIVIISSPAHHHYSLTQSRQLHFSNTDFPIWVLPGAKIYQMAVCNARLFWGFRRSGPVIGTVLVLICRAAGKMCAGEPKWETLPPPLIDVFHSLDGSIFSTYTKPWNTSINTYFTKPGVRIFFHTIIVVYISLQETHCSWLCGCDNIRRARPLYSPPSRNCLHRCVWEHTVPMLYTSWGTAACHWRLGCGIVLEP